MQVFNQEGTYVRQFGRNQLSSPNYVTVSEDNRVLVSDTNNNRIKIFNAQGRPVSAFGSTGAGKSPVDHILCVYLLLYFSIG